METTKDWHPHCSYSYSSYSSCYHSYQLLPCIAAAGPTSSKKPLLPCQGPQCSETLSKTYLIMNLSY